MGGREGGEGVNMLSLARKHMTHVQSRAHYSLVYVSVIIFHNYSSLLNIQYSCGGGGLGWRDPRKFF